MPGLTGAGLEIRTQAEIQELLEEAVAAAVPGINTRAGPVQQLIAILSEEHAIAWETLQALYSAMSPDGASGILLDQLAALTGTTRRAATKSRVTASVNLNAGTTLPIGSQAAVDGNPDAVFETVEEVTNGGGAPADVDVVLEAVETGPVAALSGTLTVIVTPVAGWNSITNTDDADEGRDRADDAELRLQRRVELAGAGSGTTAAIRAQVAKVDDVLEVQVFENTSMVPDGDGRPAKSVEAVVWDGVAPAADDDEIAQAIWDHKPAGIEVHGVGSSGDATDDTGATQAVPFTRATALTPIVVATVVLEPGTAAGWETQAEAAIAAAGDEYSVGETAYASQLICALQEVPGIAAVVSLTIAGGASLAATYDQVVRIDSSDVTVTEA